MKLCTVYKRDGANNLMPIEFSLVEDEHNFGWDGDTLHYEGKLQIVETKKED